MRRSSDFNTAVKYGRRTAQPDIVLHSRVLTGASGDDTTRQEPLVGLVIAKSVGTAVQRHRVARQLRHICRGMLDELYPAEQLVIRARPSSRHAASAQLERQLRVGLRGVHRAKGSHR